MCGLYNGMTCVGCTTVWHVWAVQRYDMCGLYNGVTCVGCTTLFAIIRTIFGSFLVFKVTAKVKNVCPPTSFYNFTFLWRCIVTNFLINKPTRRTNFSNLFYFGNETRILMFPLPVWHWWILHSRDRASWHVTVHRDTWPCIVTRDRASWQISLQSNQLDALISFGNEFHFQDKNKFQKWVHLVGLIVRELFNVF
jgi:hypothetical protein